MELDNLPPSVDHCKHIVYPYRLGEKVAVLNYDAQFSFHTRCLMYALVRSAWGRAAGRPNRVYDTDTGVPGATSGAFIYESSPPLTHPITPACKGTGFYSAGGFVAKASDIFFFKSVLRCFLQGTSARCCGWAGLVIPELSLPFQVSREHWAPLENTASPSTWCLKTPFNVLA